MRAEFRLRVAAEVTRLRLASSAMIGKRKWTGNNRRPSLGEFYCLPSTLANSDLYLKTDIDDRERYEVEFYALRPLVAESEAGVR